MSIKDRLKGLKSLWKASRGMGTSPKVFMDIAKALGIRPIRRGSMTLFRPSDIERVREVLEKYRRG